MLRKIMLVVMAMGWLAIGSTAFAADQIVVYVKSESGLNMRTNPSTKSKVIVKLPKGEPMIVIDHQGLWLKVAVDTNTSSQDRGWVHSAFVTETPTIVSYSYKELLGDELMQMASIIILYNIILDADFLVETRPTNMKAFIKQIMSPKYIDDDPDYESDDWKNPSQTYIEGGDCEDLTNFAIAKAINIFDEVGFIMMAPESSTTSSIEGSHIAAAIKDGSKVLIIDLSCATERLKVLPLEEYFKKVNTKHLTRYRIWWLIMPNTMQESIERIPK